MAVTDSPGAGRVWVAETAGPLEAEPTWTRYDALSGCRNYGFDCTSGRQSELDITDTGTANVYFRDRSGALDNDDLIGRQILLQLWNPVDNTWHPRWRGHIEDINHDLSPDLAELADVQFECVDVFELLGGTKFVPGMGDPLPSGMSGVVFYEDENVDDHIIALLDDAGIAAVMRVIFTGNVSVWETLFDLDGDVILQGLRDAADAEFPGVGNVYIDRFGRIAFHGRFARFDPEGVAASAANWDFTRWHAGTRGSVTSGVAQIREFAFNRPKDRIINSYLAYPKIGADGKEFPRTSVEALVQTDPTSIAAYGYRGKEAPSLIIKENINNGNTGAEECELFAQFYVTNYAQPRKAIRNVTFRSIKPTEDRAADVYDLMCGIDISDGLNLTVSEAGLSDVPFFVDGISVSCRPAGTQQDDITVTPNLTPASYYGTDVFDV